ncbi:DUF1499 domain-containing protein [Methylomarinum sp. Ch1-1]|uniref:DUF1499 domain-containing protein n=1 Tax=Methylomarinum roseum TaxID=3067653 RepID=A0AAU7NWT3_9GAMM
MNKVSRFGLIMAMLLLLSFLAMISLSDPMPRLGLKNGKLLPCPDSPNCVSSENMPAKALQLGHYPSQPAWKLLKNIIAAQGGNIIDEDGFYLRAEFRSRWLRFVDDLEVRLDLEKKLIHLRSASRVGHYDFGVNRNRVKAVKDKMNVYLRSHTKQPSEKK